MSAGSKKLKKELYGHPAVVGRDVISVGATAVSGTVGHTPQTDGSSGCDYFVMPRAGFVDFACANLSPVVASGSLEVAVYLNDEVIMSGALTTSNPNQFANAFNHDAGNEVAVASGDVLQCFYAVSEVLGSGGVPADHAINTRVGITYRDSQ